MSQEQSERPSHKEILGYPSLSETFVKFCLTAFLALRADSELEQKRCRLYMPSHMQSCGLPGNTAPQCINHKDCCIRTLCAANAKKIFDHLLKFNRTCRGPQGRLISVHPTGHCAVKGHNSVTLGVSVLRSTITIHVCPLLGNKERQ